jgi:hypothetical protein
MGTLRNASLVLAFTGVADGPDHTIIERDEAL